MAAVIAYALYLFLRHTKIGKAVRAVANNREAAELWDSNDARARHAVGPGVALAGVAGMLIGTLFPFTVLSGDNYTLKSFVVTVLGGFGNPLGALFAGVAWACLKAPSLPSCR